jgi:RNA polymerase sigma-70 factor (ECF subfamily)
MSPLPDLDALLPAIAAGDPDAFGRWVAGAEPRLRLSLTRYATATDCEAVLQECLLRVWQVAPRVEPDGRPDALLRFAIRVARNLAIDEVRRHRPELALASEDAPEPSEAPRPPDPHLRERIGECRDQLPEKPAQALLARLTDAGAAPDALLASRLGMTLNTFLQNFTRARRLLLDCLRRAGIDVAEELA